MGGGYGGTRFCEWPPNVFELAVDEARQRALHFVSPRRNDLRTVAFRHTQAMIHVVAMPPDPDVQDLDADGCERSDERFENSTLGGKPELDE